MTVKLSVLLACSCAMTHHISFIPHDGRYNWCVYIIYIYKKCHHLLATVKLSVSLSRVPLRQVTVVSVLVIALDAVTFRVEVKLAFGLLPLTLMKEIVSGPRFMTFGGLSRALYEIGRVMSGLRHSRATDPNTRQVNVTRSPGHVNCLSLLEVSSTLSSNEKDSRMDVTWKYLYTLSVRTVHTMPCVSHHLT